MLAQKGIAFIFCLAAHIVIYFCALSLGPAANCTLKIAIGWQKTVHTSVPYKPTQHCRQVSQSERFRFFVFPFFAGDLQKFPFRAHFCLLELNLPAFELMLSAVLLVLLATFVAVSEAITTQFVLAPAGPGATVPLGFALTSKAARSRTSTPEQAA